MTHEEILKTQGISDTQYLNSLYWVTDPVTFKNAVECMDRLKAAGKPYRIPNE